MHTGVEDRRRRGDGQSIRDTWRTGAALNLVAHRFSIIRMELSLFLSPCPPSWRHPLFRSSINIQRSVISSLLLPSANAIRIPPYSSNICVTCLTPLSTPPSREWEDNEAEAIEGEELDRNGNKNNTSLLSSTKKRVRSSAALF